MKKKTTWQKLYKKYINSDFKNWDEYFKIKMKLKRRFIKEILKRYNGKPVLECGCGTGKTSIYLAMNGIKTYGMDLENEMINQANSLANKMCNNNIPNFICGDINSIPYKDKFFSVTHSSGVLEHFEDKEIIKLLNEQLRVSDYCIFSVPTRYFDKKMLGNERFLSRKQWKKIICKSNAIIIKESGYHYKTFYKRVIDILKKPNRIFKPIALYLFVLEERK